MAANNPSFSKTSKGFTALGLIGVASYFLLVGHHQHGEFGQDAYRKRLQDGHQGNASGRGTHEH